MVDAWQEISSLKGRLAKLAGRLARQEAILSQAPAVRWGDILATASAAARYALQDRDVDATKQNAIIGVYRAGDDPGPPFTRQCFPYLLDGAGKKYILPEQRKILVQITAANQGKHVEKNSAGTVSTPPDSLTLPVVVAEGSGSFHGGYPLKVGRVFSGQKLVNSAGSGFYLVDAQGFGDATETESVTCVGTQVDFQLDSAGHIVAVETTAQPYFWRWDISGETWAAVAATNMPPNRYHHSLFTLGSKLYLRGGRIVATDTELGDVWEYNPATNAWTQLPTPSITHATRYWHLEEEKDGGGTSIFIGGYSGGIRRGTFYEFTPPNAYTLMTAEPTGVLGGPGWHLNAAGPGAICYKYDNIPFYDFYDYPSTLWGNFPCGGAAPNNVTAPAFANGASYNKSWVFGGDDAGSATNQVFYYDLMGGPAIVLGGNAPVANKDWAAAFISSTGKFLLFGGEIAGSKTDRTWLMTEATQAWVEKLPATKPPATTGHRLRALGGYVYLFGGKP